MKTQFLARAEAIIALTADSLSIERAQAVKNSPYTKSNYLKRSLDAERWKAKNYQDMISNSKVSTGELSEA